MTTLDSQAVERGNLLGALRAELLGPRDGPYELMPINDNPRDEYMTGVLGFQPFDEETDPDSDNEGLESSEPNSATPTASFDPDSDDPPEPSAGYVPNFGLMSPALDPRRLPQSLGLSFVVYGEQIPSIDILTTHARYKLEGDRWQRFPQHWHSGVNELKDRDWSVGDGVKLGMRSTQLDDNRWRVSLVFINDNDVPKGTPFEERAGYCVFQPQIRVVVEGAARLDSLGNPHVTKSKNIEDEIELNATYRDMGAYGRGHLCGAVWKEVDYEAVDDEKAETAHYWIDGETLPTDIRSQFNVPDLRTEYLPLYQISAPDMEWNSDHPKPVLETALLANLAKADELEDALIPLAVAYRLWIELEKRQVVSGSDYESQDLVRLAECSKVASRIEEGIELLRTNANARIAFCFANKAISLQSIWRPQGASLVWRPFQLAFVLVNLCGLADNEHPDRALCDLLWFPTGGGKTEAYLALSAFVLAYRRLSQSVTHSGAGAGVGVLSRYTLRLLTIQQFRRAARLITACEYLRCAPRKDGTNGWTPTGHTMPDYGWGKQRFSIGLWVGGGVTPNYLHSSDGITVRRQPIRFLGALELLRGAKTGYQGPDSRLAGTLKGKNLRNQNSEPAQMINCPACDALLSIPSPALPIGGHDLHLIVYAPNAPSVIGSTEISSARVRIERAEIQEIIGARAGYKSISVRVLATNAAPVMAEDIDSWFYRALLPLLGANARLEPARASRMGYFLVSPPRGMPFSEPSIDFQVVCPNPNCALAIENWQEEVPLPMSTQEDKSNSPGWQTVVPAFQTSADSTKSVRIPIPVYTVDDQIYARCPSMVIATVDKFARLAHEPRAASMFGSVDYYHSLLGFYREGVPRLISQPPARHRPHPSSIKGWGNLRVPVPKFDPPTLIIQDELHLIEGPLGSMVGAYEVVIEELCRLQSSDSLPPAKYLASSATVRRADTQIRSLFNRSMSIFPPPGPRIGDNFFAKTSEITPSRAKEGRLYVGVACIGRGAHTPVVRIWSRLLQRIAEDRLSGVPDQICDPYWTLVGYFNAIREMAGARALFIQDIPQRLKDRYGQTNSRQLDQLELSGRTDSVELPQLLEQLALPLPNLDCVTSVVTTSMFGTGVDISRLGLMVMHGQPKTSSAYIQATGRVGRDSPGLVVTLLRPSRPRDLDHYEFFTGYHRALHRWVEPVTVAPFSSRTRERTLGPVQVALLRQSTRVDGYPVPDHWRIEQRLNGGRWFSSAGRMASERNHQIMQHISAVLERRAQSQPMARRPRANVVKLDAGSELDRWRSVAMSSSAAEPLVYAEPAALRPPRLSVVLGDPQHRQHLLPEAFPNSPQSLREVEATTGVFVS